MKKSLYFIFTILLMCFTIKVNAINYYTSFNVNMSYNKYEYVEGLEINHNTAMGYNLFILDSNTYFNYNTTLSNPTLVSDGFQYILNNNNLTNNSSKNYYITQVAILWYEDYLNGNNNNISSSIKEYIKSNTNDTVCFYINKLVETAKTSYSNKKIVFEDKDVSFYREGNYYFSNPIKVTTNNLTSNPTIALHNAPSGSSIVNNYVTKNGTNTFQIRVPLNNLYNDNIDFEVYIKGYSTNNNYYKYSNGLEAAILAFNNNNGNNIVEESMPVIIKEGNKVNIKVKVVDKNNYAINGVKYNIYKGECNYNTCEEGNLVDTFITSSNYSVIESIFQSGTYTFIRMTNTKYNLNKTEVIKINDTNNTQSYTFKEVDNNNDYNKGNDNYNDTTNKKYNIRIYNPNGVDTNVIKIYKNNELMGSFRGDIINYNIELYSNTNYKIIDSNNSLNVSFDVMNNGEIYVLEGSNKVKRDYINLDNYLLRYPTGDMENNEENNKNDNIIYEDEKGNISINTSNGDTIEISQNIEANADVKIDWISNIIDCPITSVSSTIKYIFGALILALGILLTIKNVKKSKNNI